MIFGWISDSHLDCTQYGLERRRLDFASAFRSAVEDMLSQQIRIIINSGDIINSNRPSPATMQFLRVVNDILRAKNAVMYVVSGNHDRTDPHWIETLGNPDASFGIQMLDFKMVKHHHPDNPNGVSFYGVPFMAPDQFRKHQFVPADVLVMHQMVQEFVDYEQADCVKLADIPPLYKLIALGDVHVHKIIEQAGRPHCFVGYPGSTEMKSETEDETKYWVECHLDVNGWVTLLPHKIDTRQVIRIKITDPATDTTGIDAAIVSVHKLEHRDRGFGIEYGDPGYRPPIIFITYLNTLTEVMPKFKAAFDPDRYILRFEPVFGKALTQSADGTLVEDKDNLTIEDILRGELATHPELFGIASQLINTDVDANAAIDEFIEQRLRAVKATTAIVHV